MLHPPVIVVHISHINHLDPKDSNMSQPTISHIHISDERSEIENGIVIYTHYTNGTIVPNTISDSMLNLYIREGVTIK